jgi:acyl-homoserine-lactone acylase
MALSFTEGSIGGDIEDISLSDLATFYGGTPIAKTAEEHGTRPAEPRGSNGIALAPRLTRNGRALLLINPHTSFYFRSEMQMTSDEGLNAYGASTWGQFFIYQGFNSRIGWMHTSSGVDSVDEFALATVRRGDGYHYRYGNDHRPLTRRPVTILVRWPDGGMAARRFVTWRSHHGPIVAARDGKWIAQALMWRPIPALEQSWLRTKAKDLASYLAVSARQANSSNATIIADANGQIAYLHPQFVPVRDNRFDYTRPVDGSDPATDWRGLHSLASLPQSISPPTGWTMNTNNWPWTAAGAASPRASDFPRYMDSAGENARGINALLLLKDARQMTPQKLMALAYDSYLPAFATLVPQLVAAFDALPATDPQRARLEGPIALLRRWDKRWSLTSEATSLAVFWGDGLGRDVGATAKAQRMNLPDYIATRVTPADKLAALSAAVEKLERDFGSWRVPWGRINRFQRLDNQITPHFDDSKPSIAIPFTSAQWGSLASYGARSYPNTKRYYGTLGNSFVAIVEFGPKLRAWAVMAGGQSGDPRSKHFADQAKRYASGQLRPIYFYPADLQGHVSRRYSPGQKAARTARQSRKVAP